MQDTNKIFVNFKSNQEAGLYSIFFMQSVWCSRKNRRQFLKQVLLQFLPTDIHHRCRTRNNKYTKYTTQCMQYNLVYFYDASCACDYTLYFNRIRKHQKDRSKSFIQNTDKTMTNNTNPQTNKSTQHITLKTNARKRNKPKY